MKNSILSVIILFCLSTLIFSQDLPGGEEALGTKKYEQYEKPEACKSCHPDIYQQWTQAMMSQAYTHHWDEIEYFDLAVEHGKVDPKFAPVADGCNGCHTPIAFLSGDVPPPRPSENSRANESVSCDVCHTIKSFKGDEPFNFSYISQPGRLKWGNKPGLTSPHHDTEESDFMKQAEFCGNCHNEKDPFGIWVKSTHLEWKEGPYAKQGVPCHQCHMPKAWGKNATMAEKSMVSQHLFHGGHDAGKVAGTIELRMHPEEREVEYDGTIVLKVQLFNGKTGHKFPTGSVEDRIVWLHVTATDANGKEYHLPVDKKGFDGEEYTIAADVLAYQDMGIPKRDPNFKGVQRDGVPFGDRIFRMPYFDPQGRMTIMQWNTASLGVDYRFGPRETKIETFSWVLPGDIPEGKVNFKAKLFYQLLVKPVGDYLGVPEEETTPILVNSASTWVEIYE
ncbi:NapC/NirT family cytochrome c [candidate division KSB1 bacterium]|nr:NapC/NirT family cytochrome c [candidate division KSB1 bacterium]